MINVYDYCPIYETESFLFRLVRLEDAEALLKCYSDKEIVSKMNSDYCTSDFYYSTVEEMGYKSIDEMVKTMKNKETKKEIDTDTQTKKEINGLYKLAEHRAKNGDNIFMRLKDGTLYNDICERLKKYGILESESMQKIQNIQFIRNI